MKQVVIKQLLKREDSTLNQNFEDFVGFYGFKPILCRPYWGQTKGKVERRAQFVRDNFMVGIKYNKSGGPQRTSAGLVQQGQRQSSCYNKRDSL